MSWFFVFCYWNPPSQKQIILDKDNLKCIYCRFQVLLCWFLYPHKFTFYCYCRVYKTANKFFLVCENKIVSKVQKINVSFSFKVIAGLKNRLKHRKNNLTKLIRLAYRKTHKKIHKKLAWNQTYWRQEPFPQNERKPKNKLPNTKNTIRVNWYKTFIVKINNYNIFVSRFQAALYFLQAFLGLRRQIRDKHLFKAKLEIAKG